MAIASDWLLCSRSFRVANTEIPQELTHTGASVVPGCSARFGAGKLGFESGIGQLWFFAFFKVSQVFV